MRSFGIFSFQFKNSARSEKLRVRFLRDQRGQIVVEYMLLLVVTVALATLLTTTLRNSGALKAFVFDPFAKFDGMIQCGVWEPCGITAKVPNKHSNTGPRVLSLDPERGPR